MLRVTLSNRLEELAAAVADALPAGDPFATTTIVVPGRLVGRWLQYELARRRGVAGGLALTYLEPLLERALTGDEAARRLGLVGLDRPRLGAMVASALAKDDVTDGAVMAPVRAYLDADGRDDEARAVRRAQLATRVAGLFWDYALTRPAWLDAWSGVADGGRAAEPRDVDPATAAWQRALFDATLGPRGAAHAPGPDGDGAPRHRVVIPALARARARLGLPPPRLDGPVHVVGFSYLAVAQLEGLRALAEGGDVHLAMVSPCAELWEDVPGRRRRREAAAAGEPLGLVLWGGPGRDASRALIGATEGDVDERHVEPDGGAALAAWARDLLHRAPPPAALPAAPVDPGLRVLACPSVARELEIVGSEIWALLAADPTLRASDVAILIAADHDRYLAQVGPVLGALHRLPFHVVDAPAAGAGRVAEAARLLLELPLGRATRRELLAVMTHPAVLARHPHVDPADWVQWCERLGIVHGADARDHQATYLADVAPGTVEAFHWEQGLRRLALGAFVAGARAGVREPVRVGGKELLPEELAPDQHASAATFALLARSLLADARWLRGHRATLTTWADILAAAIDTYVGAPADGAPGAADGDGARERARVLDELRGLAALDLDGRELPYAEALELARDRLGRLREGRGEPLTHGVMVAALEPNRPLPTRVTYVIGLGEGAFPAGEHASPLDLRATREPGDVSLRDRDRYGFLEAVLATRERLTLSYVARDELSGEPLAPSSVVHELAEMLAPYLGERTAADALARLTLRHPLRRWDDAYAADPRLVPSASPAAVRERHAAAVRDALADHLLDHGRATPDAARLRELLAQPDLMALRAGLKLDLADGVPPPPEPEAEAAVTVSLSMLRRFLESPVQAWAQVVLRLQGTADEDDLAEAAERQDEPFDADALDRAMLLREAFGRHLSNAGEPGDPAAALAAAYADARRHRVLSGHAALGLFGDVAAEADLRQLVRWAEALAAHGAAGPWTRLAFGRASVDGARLHEPIALDVTIGGASRRVELVGTTELLGGPALERSLVLVNRNVRPDHHLRHALDHVALAAAGVTAGRRRDALVLGDKAVARGQPAWDQATARAYLAALCGELLGAGHAYLLPFETAVGVLKGKALALNKKKGAALGFGPLRRDHGLALPPDALAMIQRRLAPLHELLEELR